MDAFDGKISVLKWRLAAARFQASAHGLSLTLKAGFRPNQPRAPRGQPDGGRWVRGPGGAQVHRVARRRGGGGQIRIGGRSQFITPAQQDRLADSVRALNQALRDVRRVDPKWTAPP